GEVSLTATAYSKDGGKGQEIGSTSLDYAFVDNSVEGITVAVNDSTVEEIDGTAADDTLSLRTYTGTSTTTEAGEGSDEVIIYGSEEIPEGNYHQMLDALKENPIQTATEYFGASHSVDLGDDADADSLSLVSELGAQPKFMLKHTKGDGRINGAGVAGENGAAYDHWAGVFGFIDIDNFDPDEDTLKLAGHTTKLGESFTKDGDFYQTVYSEQNANDQSGPRAGAAHDDTFLGLLRFEGGADQAEAIADAITVDGMRTFVVKGLGKDIFEGDPTDNQVGDTITDEELFTFALVNTETDEVVQELTEGAAIDLNELDFEKFSVVAQVNPDHFYASEVESVKFESNLGDRTENVVPYALFGDKESDYWGKDAELGDVSLTATAYSKDGGKGQEIGSSSLNYAFVENAEAASSGTESTVDTLTGMSSSEPLTGDLTTPDALTNVASTTDEFSIAPELMLDDPFEVLAVNATDAVAADAAIGTGETDSDPADLDPFGDALPIGTQPTLMESAYMPG
ncbi:MAG: hypothetical protein AAGA01_07310, partial [Cyanobacteria bacterium P01_E01_bin.43]